MLGAVWKRRIVGAALLLGAGGLALLAVGIVLVRRLDTPAFRDALLERVKAALGTDVRVRKMDVSLLSGVRLEGVGIANPAPFQGDMLTADEFVFRYRWLPLLAGRIAVDRVALKRPTLTIAADSRGGYNFERLGGGPARTTSGPSRGTGLPFALDLSRLTVDGGRVGFKDAHQGTLLTLEGTDLSSSLGIASAGTTGKGKIAIARVVLASGVAVTQLKAPLEIAGGRATLAPVAGRLAGGDVTGRAVVDLASARFTSEIELRNVDLKALAAEARSRPGFSGRLGAKAKLEGSGGVATLKGGGGAQVADCRVEESRLFGVIAAAVQVPELSHPELDECRAEFSLGGGLLRTPVVRAKGPSLALTGSGSVNLLTTGLDYRMTLALASKLLDRIRVNELRAAFRDRGDGFGTLDFNVTGTTSEPRTDIAAHLAKAAIGSKLWRLFDRVH
jgi:hypothetical protein